MDGLLFLLLQARLADDPMRAQERRCFAGKLGIEPERIVCWDLLKGPPALSIVAEHDILLMGGSGDFLVSQSDLPQFAALLGLLRDVTERGHPFFASCFGFQCLTAALGGEVVYDPDSTEVGTYELALTEAGHADPLLGALPATFAAQMGRKDRARALPPGAVHLAASRRCPYQAFRIEGKPIWATQFHPELSGDENRERFVKYQENYETFAEGGAAAATLERFTDSPHTADMLVRFVDLAGSGRSRLSDSIPAPGLSRR